MARCGFRKGGEKLYVYAVAVAVVGVFTPMEAHKRKIAMVERSVHEWLFDAPFWAIALPPLKAQQFYWREGSRRLRSETGGPFRQFSGAKGEAFFRDLRFILRHDPI